MMHELAKILPRRRGLMVVEAALLFPLLFLITFGLIEYGLFFIASQQVTNCARQAARQAATAFATQGDVDTTISTLLTGYNLQDKGPVVNQTPPNCATATRGQTVTVTITIPFANIDVIHFLPSAATPNAVHATVVMEKEGA
jgi:Flp pilus assembly protein TadG